MVMSRDFSCKFQKFLSLVQFCIKFKEKSPDLEEIDLRTKQLQATSKTRGGKHPLPPSSAYRVKGLDLRP